MLPRKHYRGIARELAKLTAPAAQEAVQAINDLLEDRARLSRRVLRAENALSSEPPVEAPKKSLLSRLIG